MATYLKIWLCSNTNRQSELKDTEASLHSYRPTKKAYKAAPALLNHRRNKNKIKSKSALKIKINSNSICNSVLVLNPMCILISTNRREFSALIATKRTIQYLIDAARYHLIKRVIRRENYRSNSLPCRSKNKFKRLFLS